MNPIPEHIHRLSPELHLAAQAAAAAGEIIRNGYGQLQNIQSKGVGDFVSDIDRQADEVASQILQTDPSGTAILSEELSPEVDGDNEELWIVDPLDGTSSFLFKTGPHYSSVLIALRKNSETQLGIVYFPVTDEWFYAEKGKGAFKNGEILTTSDQVGLKQGWVELNQYGDSAFESDLFANLRRQLRTENGARLVTQHAPYSGVAMRIAENDNVLVAAVHDNHPDSVKQAAWDISAPQCILEEAGGVFVTKDGSRVDPFVSTPFIVAANRQIADDIIKLAQ